MLESGVAKVCKICSTISNTNKIVYDGIVSFLDTLYTIRSAHGTQKEHMDIANACKKSLFDNITLQ